MQFGANGYSLNAQCTGIFTYDERILGKTL